MITATLLCDVCSLPRLALMGCPGDDSMELTCNVGTSNRVSTQHTSECDPNKFFSSLESASHICSREKKTPLDTRKRDVEACVLTPSIPARTCVGAVWVAYWACQRYHHLCLSQHATGYMGFLELKKCLFKRGWFGCGEFFWCSDWHEIVILVPLHLMPV